MKRFLCGGAAVALCLAGITAASADPTSSGMTQPKSIHAMKSKPNVHRRKMLHVTSNPAVSGMSGELTSTGAGSMRSRMLNERMPKQRHG